jgi:hypothetical protein
MPKFLLLEANRYAKLPFHGGTVRCAENLCFIMPLHILYSLSLVAAVNASTASAAVTILFKSAKTGKTTAKKVMAIKTKDELCTLIRKGRFIPGRKL